MGEIDLNSTKTPKREIQIPPYVDDVSNVGYAQRRIARAMKGRRLTNKGPNNRYNARSTKDARRKAIKGSKRYEKDKALATKKFILRTGIISALVLSGLGKIISSESVQSSVNDAVGKVFDLDARNTTKQQEKFLKDKLKKENNGYVDTFAELIEYKRNGGNLQRFGISDETFDRAREYYEDYLALLSVPNSTYDFNDVEFEGLYEQGLKEKIAHAIGYDYNTGESSINLEDISFSSILHGDGIPFKTTDESIVVNGTKYVEKRGVLGTGSETHNTIDSKTAQFVKTAEKLKHPKGDQTGKRRFLEAFPELSKMLTTTMTQQRPRVSKDGVKGKAEEIAIKAGENGILVGGNHLGIKSTKTREKSVYPPKGSDYGDR